MKKRMTKIIAIAQGIGCFMLVSCAEETPKQEVKKESKLVIVQENIFSLDRRPGVFVIDKILSYYQEQYEFLVGDSLNGFSVDFCNVRNTKIFFKDTIPCAKVFIWHDPEARINGVDSSKVELYLPENATIRTVGGRNRRRSSGAPVHVRAR